MSDKPLTDISFSSFDLHPALQAGLEAAGFSRVSRHVAQGIFSEYTAVG